MKKSTMILAGCAVAAVLTILCLITTYTSTRNEGRTKELGLTAEYKAIMADYGQFRAAAIDQLGIAKDKSKAMDEILTNAISGRYNKPGSPQVDSGKLFSAVQEAYPDLKGLDVFDKIVDFVAKGRKEFSQRQEKIAGSVQAYNTWRTTGSFLHPMFVSLIGFPSNSIEVRAAGKITRGQAALDMMSTPIISEEAGKIFDNGVDQQLPTGK